MIEELRNTSRSGWYDSPQVSMWEGSYRHHLHKRRAYIESVVAGHFKYRFPSIGLDLCCGDGANFWWLSKCVREFYGCDYNLLRLKRAYEIGKAKAIFLIDATDCAFADESFDFIFFNHALEHIKDDRAALSEAHRILKTDGLLVLGVPNEGEAFWQLAYRLQPDTLRNTDHIHFYTASRLISECRGAGFKILEIKHLGWGVPHWTLDEWLRRYKWVDDAFEVVGQRFFRNQASSLYAILSK